MNELPDSIFALFAYTVALSVTSLSISYGLWRRHVKGKAPLQIATALAGSKKDLASIKVLTTQLKSMQLRATGRKARRLAALAEKTTAWLATVEPQTARLTDLWNVLYTHPGTNGSQARTLDMFALREQLLPLADRAATLHDETQSLSNEFRDELRNGPTRIATASRLLYAQIMESVDGPMHALRTQYGLQGDAAHQAFLEVDYAADILRKLPSMLWNSNLKLDTSAIPPEHIDGADLVTRRYDKRARAAMERIQQWLTGIEAASAAHQEALTRRKTAAAFIEAQLTAVPDPLAAIEWTAIGASLDDLTRQLAQVDVDAISALEKSAKLLLKRLDKLDEQAQVVAANIRECNRLPKPATPRDGRWRDSGEDLAQKLGAFHPDNFSRSIGIDTLKRDVRDVYASWLAVNAPGPRRWQSWMALGESIETIKALDASLSERIATGKRELSTIEDGIAQSRTVLENSSDMLQAMHEDFAKRRAIDGHHNKIKQLHAKLNALQTRQGRVQAIRDEIQTFEAALLLEASNHVSAIATGITERIDELKQIVRSLTESASLTSDETLKHARSVVAKSTGQPTISSGSMADLARSMRALGASVTELNICISTLSHWNRQLGLHKTQLNTAKEAVTAATNRRSRAMNLLPAWVDGRTMDEEISSLRRVCTQTANEREASKTLQHLEANLQTEHRAQQQLQQAYARQTEQLDRIHVLQQDWERRISQDDVRNNRGERAIAAVLERGQPSSYMHIPVDRAEAHFGELIADLVAALARFSSEDGRAPEMNDGHLRDLLAEIEAECMRQIAREVPLRDTHALIRDAKAALADAGHRNRYVAVPHLQDAVAELKRQIAAASGITDERRRDRRLAGLYRLRDGVESALAAAGYVERTRF